MNPGPIETARQLMEQGGWVMWPLLVMSLASLAMTFERALFWLATNRPGRGRWLITLCDLFRAHNHDGVRSAIRGDSSVYAATAGGVLERGTSDAAVIESVEAVRPAIERFSTAQSTIITAAPLLGILGTVTGIIRSFSLLSSGVSQRVTDPSLVAGGVAEALITTAFGMVVAILALIPYAIFRAKSDRCLGRLEVIAAAAQQGELAADDADIRRARSDRPARIPASVGG
ncbi:MAG: MotA/TolQ/ExbB proton channel family protein [Phycisphaeraceae bacterium]|nr:MotA/TolQ/ExbB proton channel family protein [Phycisphaeraceae bacterium]MCB9847501.1 MotA/TolQ/ExbB proton channel family protein [Phycisphaeraceae bacterium]